MGGLIHTGKSGQVEVIKVIHQPVSQHNVSKEMCGSLDLNIAFGDTRSAFV